MYALSTFVYVVIDESSCSTLAVSVKHVQQNLLWILKVYAALQTNSDVQWCVAIDIDSSKMLNLISSFTAGRAGPLQQQCHGKHGQQG